MGGQAGNGLLDERPDGGDGSSDRRQGRPNGMAAPSGAPRPEGTAKAESDSKASKDKEGPSKTFVDEDSKSPEYRDDEWRMQYFKVISCSKRFSHDWTVCPYAHPGEKARRRDLKVFEYAGISCPDMKLRSYCPRGDKCKYAHNVFEYWMHPGRYRTQTCNDGANCQRHACFFAHDPSEIRSNETTIATLEAEKQEQAIPEPQPEKPFTFPCYGQQSSFDFGQNNASYNQHLPNNHQQRSSSMTSDESRIRREGQNARHQRPNPQDLSVNFANGHRGSGSNDLADAFSALLRNGNQGDQGLAARSLAETNTPQYQAKVWEAIMALDPADVQYLLKVSHNQRLAESLSRRSSDTHALAAQQRQDSYLAQLNAPGRVRRSPLHTAPAGLEQYGNQHSLYGSLSGNANADHLSGTLSGSISGSHMSGNLSGTLSGNHLPGGLNGYDGARQAEAFYQQDRLTQTDMANLSSGGLDGLHNINDTFNSMYNQDLQNLLRQEQANKLARYSSGLTEPQRMPSSNIIARMSQQDASQFNLQYPQNGALYSQNEGLYNTYSGSSSHNASALRNQMFSLDDVTTQQARVGPSQPQTAPQRTAPVASAFQSVASQDWQPLSGRGAQNLHEDNAMQNSLNALNDLNLWDRSRSAGYNVFGGDAGQLQGQSHPQTSHMLPPRSSPLHSAPHDPNMYGHGPRWP